MSKYYRLKENVLLRGWIKLPNAIRDKHTGETVFISEMSMNILKMCNSKIDFEAFYIPPKWNEYALLAVKNNIIEECNQGDGINKEQEYYQYPSRYIKAAHWSITGKCNYRCRHCFMSAPDAKYGELSNEVCIDIINQLAECGISQISLTGGEPLVRKDFMELVDAIIAKGMHIITIYSNGHLVTREFLSQLAKRHVFPEINMSYDGIGFHDWLRGVNGAEKDVEKAFRLCEEMGFRTAAELCIHQLNKNVLRESINKLSEWGCKSVKTNPVSPAGSWVLNHENKKYEIDTKELFNVYLNYIPKYFEDNQPIDLHLGGFFICNKKSMDYILPSLKFENNEKAKEQCICGHARLTMYIAADGRVLPCMPLSGMEDIQSEFPLITQIGLKQCLTQSSYMSLIDTRLKDYLDANEKCMNCEHKYICGGGCRACSLCLGNGLMGVDEISCELIRGGYIEKIKTCIPQKTDKNNDN